MLHLLSHGHGSAVAVGPGGRHHGAAVLLASLVHPEELKHHKSVAGHNGQNKHQHDGGVQVGVGPVLSLHGVHVDEAPGTGAVLHIFTKAQERQEAENHTQQEQERDGDVSTLPGHMSAVQVRVSNGKTPL